MTTTAVERRTLEIDYPAKNEVVNSLNYTFRISAPEDAAAVEVSVDRGAWQLCRESCGHWWYDWSGFKPGTHSLSARAVEQTGEMMTSPLRRFVVEGAQVENPEPPTPLRRHPR